MPNSLVPMVIASDYCETCNKITPHIKISTRKLTQCRQCPYSHVPTEKFTIIKEGRLLAGMFIEDYVMDELEESYGR